MNIKNRVTGEVVALGTGKHPDWVRHQLDTDNETMLAALLPELSEADYSNGRDAAGVLVRRVREQRRHSREPDGA